MREILTIICILVVVLVFFYLIKKNQKRRTTHRSSVNDMDQFMSLQFSLDHAEFTLNQSENLYPFAMTMSNNGVDTNFYNFENKEISMDSIHAQLKESETDIDLVFIISNDEKDSRLEIQRFLKGVKRSQLFNISYKIVGDKYQLDRQNLKPIKEQASFLY